MWFGGKHKSHAPLDLQEIGFGGSKTHRDAATDGWSDSETAHKILHDVLVKLESFIFPTHFVILDYEVDFEVPIIIGRSFLATGRALFDMEKGQMKFRLNNKEVTFNICRSMRQSGELQSVSAISYRVEESSEVQIEERLGVEALAALIMNFDSDCIEE